MNILSVPSVQGLHQQGQMNSKWQFNPFNHNTCSGNRDSTLVRVACLLLGISLVHPCYSPKYSAFISIHI